MRPRYQRSVCWRLKSAVRCLRKTASGSPRERLTRALLIIYVFHDEEFPADFRTAYREIMEEVQRGERSIGETVAALPEERVQALGQQIIDLYTDTCEA